MGFRTVIVLSNDQAHEWMKDPLLGAKIWESAATSFIRSPVDHFQYGTVIEQVHADVESLAVLDGYGGRTVATSHWHSAKTAEDTELELLKKLADKLGYHVYKKPK